jgi:IS30 family transposase
MSFQEDFDLHAQALLRLVDAGVSGRAAAPALGITRMRAWAILRACGRGRGPSKVITDDQRERVLASFAQDAVIEWAARAGGCDHKTARRILVKAGVLTAGAPVPRPKRARFEELVESGLSAKQAAHEVGVHKETGRVWAHEIRASKRRVDTDRHSARSEADYTEEVTTASTALTVVEPAPIKARLLSLHDRLAIADGLVLGRSRRAIAASIGRPASTVCREIEQRRIAGTYLPHQAHEAAVKARGRPKTSKLVTEAALRTQVEDGLRRKLSPEQISNRLVKDFPDDETMRVSHETIYQALYFQARGGLKREVAAALRTGRTRRKPQRHPDQRQHRFIDPMVMISDRPAEAEDRAVPGHWEGDLIMGANNQTAIATLVERTTRYTMLVHLPGGHSAEEVRDQLIATIATLPAHLRGSLTWDQGCEMAQHKSFAIATDMAVYFCDPASPWQRGTNENTNGLLRQYFPKGTDLSVHGPEDLEHVAQELNGRPRKTLDWDTPAERLRDLLISQ